MLLVGAAASASEVVLLAEDVDRNINSTIMPVAKNVVLLAEDVDRNVLGIGDFHRDACRPPRGGRG